MTPEELSNLTEEIAMLSAQINALTARRAQRVARLEESDGWADGGVRSCAHWLSIHSGDDMRTAGETVRAGSALNALPLLSEAFADGRLSFDKIRAVTRVATPDDEPMWLDVALHATAPQLKRICLAVHRALDADDPRRSDDELAHRGVHVWWREDGMLELMAVLPREDGALVMAAVDAVSQQLVTERRDPADGSPSDLRPPALRQPVLRADALVRICEDWVARASTEPVLAPTRQVVVHIDAATLTGADPAGRCHLEDGPWLSQRAARWLGCDADVVTILERDGLPIDVGRLNRLVPPRLRLALQARDKGCRYPVCAVPARRTEGHHIKHWADGGPTNMDNLASLCRFHHHRHHEGKFNIRVDAGGELHFELPDGTPLVPVTPRAAGGPLTVPSDITSDTALAVGRGEPCSFDYAVAVLADESVRLRDDANRSRAGPVA